jgi:small-conductance mechanosensitive channel
MDTRLLPDIQPILQALIKALPLALIVLLAAAALQFVIGRGLAFLATRTRLAPAELLPLKKVLNSILYLITVVLILTVFGVNLGGLWAVMSTILAMVAIGFVAVWSLLSNVSSTLIILFFRPFAIGDELEFVGEPVKGKVIDLNFLYTTLRAEDGAFIQIPNNLFFQKSLRRRPSVCAISLAEQLNRPQAAEV